MFRRCQQQEHKIWQEIEKQKNREFIQKKQKKARRAEARGLVAAWAKKKDGN